MQQRYVSTTDVWRRQLRLCKNGHTVFPRGAGCLEVLGPHVRIPINAPIVLSKKRKLSYRFMGGEALWILTGKNRVDDQHAIKNQLIPFSDDGRFMFGAYGPKFVEQLPYVIECLNSDKHSRQAVINIWRESPMKSKDVPCTLNIQFLLRSSVLHAIVNMRSSDVWLGLPYDMFTFSMMTQYVGLLIEPKCTCGTLQINMGSSHLYLRDRDKAHDLLEHDEQIRDEVFIFEKDHDDLLSVLEHVSKHGIISFPHGKLYDEFE